MDVLQVAVVDRVIAVVRAQRVADPVGLADTFANAGIRCVEFTFTIPNVTSLLEAASSSQAVVGAGTVLTAEEARTAVDAGARFLVTPVVRPEVVGAAGGIPVFMGAFTPTEIVDAVGEGAAAVKVFPAAVGGPGYIRDLRGPFPDLALIPSGGISQANARQYLDAGAVAVYAGSSLAPPDLVADGDCEVIGRRARAFIEALA